MNSKRNEMFKTWGLTDNPFTVLPPPDENERKYIFTGRDHEVRRICNLVRRPRGLFVCGMFGVGKTILVRECLRRLGERGVIETYSIFNPRDGFLKTILKGLAKRVAEMGKAEREFVYELVTKRTVSRITKKGMSAKVSAMFVEGGIDRIKEYVESVTTEIENPIDIIEKLISKVTSKGRSVLIAVDDIEKKGDVSGVQEIMHDVRDIITFGGSVVLTGHPIGVTRDFRTSSGGMLVEIPLEQLSGDELVEMMIKYLNTARGDDKGTYPFERGAAGWIAEEHVRHKLTPRLFNLACFHLLENAGIQEYKVIGTSMLRKHWLVIAEKLLRNIEEKDKKYIRTLYRLGGIDEDSEEAIIEIGGELAEYEEIRNALTNLIHNDILIEREVERKRKIELHPIIRENLDLES